MISSRQADLQLLPVSADLREQTQTRCDRDRSFIDSLGSLSFLRLLRVVPCYLKYFYFLDDPLGDGFVVCANHPSGHQIEGSP